MTAALRATRCGRPRASSSAARSRPTCRSGRTPARCRASCTAQAAKQGLLGVSFPEEVGGEGGDLLDSVDLQEGCFEAGASSGLMAALFTGGIALPHIAASGNADLIDRFVRPTLAGEKIGSLAITEPGGGSDVAGIRTTAPCATATTTSSTAPRPSSPRASAPTSSPPPSAPAAPGHAGVSLLVVEKGTPGFTVDRSLTKMGWHCSDTAELSYVDVRVPAANLVGAENTRLRTRSPTSSSSSGSGSRSTPTASPPARWR